MSKITSAAYRIIFTSFIMSAFLSCMKVEPPSGVPSAKFIARGIIVCPNVVNPEINDYIQGLEVSLVEINPEGTETGKLSNSTLTAVDGSFTIIIFSNPASDNDFIIKIKDVDGKEHGRFFPLELPEPVFAIRHFTNGNGDWYMGETITDLGEITVECAPAEPGDEV